MNKVFERNILALRDEALKEQIMQHEYVSRPILMMTNGYNVQYNGIYLHSEESPLAESQQIFQSVKSDEKNIHIIYGLGLGYLFQLAVKESNSIIILYEPNLDILYNAFTLVDFSQEFVKQNVFVFTDFDLLLRFLSQNVRQNTSVDIISLPSYRELYKDVFKDQAKKIELTFGSVLLDYGFKRKRLYASTVNTIYNIPRLLKETPINKFEGIYAGKTAIIVSAGPTLSENIELLKDAQNKAVIFSVGPALKTLVENNIKPDFLCIIEVMNCSKQVAGLDLSDINLILEPYTNKNIQALETKNKFVHISSNMPSSQYFADVVGLSTEGYLAQGTVSYMALNTAVKMGFSKIIFVGQDLAYVEGQCYSKGSAYEDLVCKLNPETGKYEITALDFDKFVDSLSSSNNIDTRIRVAKDRLRDLNSGLYYVKGIDGNMVPTEAGYASFINHFADYAKSLNDIELINTSLKGAQIEGFKNIPLKEALSGVDEINKIELETGFDYDIEAILNKLSITKSNLNSALKTCEECGKLASRLNMDYKRNKNIDKDKLLKIRKLIEEYMKLNDYHSKDNLIFKYTTASEEMTLNDTLTQVTDYNDKTTPIVITELKKYYEDVIKRLSIVIPMLDNVIKEVEHDRSIAES